MLVLVNTVQLRRPNATRTDVAATSSTARKNGLNSLDALRRVSWATLSLPQATPNPTTDFYSGTHPGRDAYLSSYFGFLIPRLIAILRRLLPRMPPVSHQAEEEAHAEQPSGPRLGNRGGEV